MSHSRQPVPAYATVLPRQLGLAPSSRELYGFHLRLLAERHGRRKIDQLTTSDITELGVWAQAMAVSRSTSISGASARDTPSPPVDVCSTLRSPIADRRLPHNPVKAVRKPQRQESRRTALTDEQVAEVSAPFATSRSDCSRSCSRPQLRPLYARGRDEDDLRALAGILRFSTVEAALELCSRFFAEEEISPSSKAILEDLFRFATTQRLVVPL